MISLTSPIITTGLISLLFTSIFHIKILKTLYRLAETKGNFAEAAEMQDFESKKPTLARKIIEARKKGDMNLAHELCDELNSLSTLRFDPTNPEGVVNAREFDVEEWYYQARIRVYGIIAA